MALPVLPRAQSPIAGTLQTPQAWYDFFRNLLAFVTDNEGDIAQIADILARLEALENEADVIPVIQGSVSVQVIGSLESGLVSVQLINDQNAPGNTYYYGTGPTGDKGWFTVASALAQGAGITLSTAGTGVTTIAHADTSSVANLTSDNSNGVVIQDVTQTFDTFGHVLTSTVGTKDVWASPVLTGDPTAPTPPAGDSDTSVATTAFVTTASPNLSYRHLMQANSIITAGTTAGTYALTSGGDGAILSGANTAFPPQSIYIDAADYPSVNGATAKLRVRAQLYVNDTAPTGDYTFGLYPITRPATSGGAGVNIYTMGTVVAGSTFTFAAPAADALLSDKSANFELLATGHYVIGVATTATVAANSNIQMTAYLQMNNAPSASDPYFASVTSLLHMDGPDGSTTFTDQIGGVSWSATDNAQIDTSQSKFGGASGLSDGTNDRITTSAAVSGHDFGSGDFTIEAQVRTTVTPGAGLYKVIAARDDTSVSSNRGWLFLLDGDNSGKLKFTCRVGTTAYPVTNTTTLSLNTWYYVAAVRDGGTLRLYVDGVQVASTAITGTLNDANVPTRIFDGNNAGGSLGSWNGWIDEVRITKGVCRYPSGTTFTPPSAAFPNS